MTSSPELCVAAIDLNRLSTVRLLQWNRRYWPDNLTGAGLQPGRVVRQKIRPIQDARGFPHQTEDTQLTDTLEMLELIPEPQLFRDLGPIADGSVEALFGGNLHEGRYVIDGTHCRSLGSVLAAAASADITLDGFGKARLSFEDSTGQMYLLPVTDLRVSNDRASDFVDTRRRLQIAQDARSQLLLRVGLGRGFDGRGQWNPKRCFLQVNGIIFPS